MRDSNFSTPYLQNLPYLYAEDGQLNLQPEGTKVYYPARKDTLYLYGYYPYTTEAATDEHGKVSIPVTAALEANEATDYLTPAKVKGSKKAAATAAGIPVSLKHALARLCLNISTNRPEYTAESYPVLQSIGFTTREGQKGTMDLQTGDITSDSPDTGTSVISDYQDRSNPTRPYTRNVRPSKGLPVAAIQARLYRSAPPIGVQYKGTRRNREGHRCVRRSRCQCKHSPVNCTGSRQNHHAQHIYTQSMAAKAP